MFVTKWPEGRPRVFDVSSCLESPGCHLIPFFNLISCYSAWSFCLLFLLLAHSPTFFLEMSLKLFYRKRLFCVAFVFKQLGNVN